MAQPARKVHLPFHADLMLVAQLAEINDAPRPFTWTADPDKIIAAVRRGHQALDLVR